jgi:TM2 domain-containing membrane protein YozV
MDIIDENGNVVQKNNQESKRILAGILAILLGALGVHKFVLGYTTQGIVMLVITIFTFGFGASLTGLIGLIEGIIYLTKSDAEFIEMYQKNEKHWF